jgi:SAM-dependent methyltransferase
VRAGAARHDCPNRREELDMSFEEIMGTVQHLSTATDALAAIGAELSITTSGEAVDPGIESALGAVRTAAGVPDLGSLAPPQQAMVLNLIRLFFAQANDLLAEPARAPGWTFTDPLVLEGMGRGSMMIPPVLRGAAPELANVTSLLDVGAGVGWLAVSAANTWPDATVVGVDVWEPALERARTNVREAGLDERVTLRNQDITALDDIDTYDCAWVPTFFLTDGALVKGLTNIVNAVRPGGWIVLGRFAPPPDPLTEATMTLKTIRSGGGVLSDDRAKDLLQDAGCTSIRVLERPGPLPMNFVIGQKPEATP